MNWDQDAINKLLAVPTPDLSIPPPTVDKDEPGLQDATVMDAATIAPVLGAASKAAPLAGDLASSIPKTLASESGQLRIMPSSDLSSMGDKIIAARKAGMYSPSDISTSAMPGSDLNALGDKLTALRDGKSAAEAAAAKAQATRWLEQRAFADKTFGDRVKGYANGGPVIKDSTLEGFAALLKKTKGVDPSSGTAKGYDNGGPIEPDDIDESDTPKEGPMADGSAPVSDEPSLADKLKAVLAKMGINSPMDAAAGAARTIANPIGALMTGGSGAILGAGSQIAKAELPVVAQTANALLNSNHPIPAASPAPVAPPMPPAPAQTAPVAPPTAPPVAAKPVNVPAKPDSSAAPVVPGTGPVANMLQTMTGGDSDKLQQVLSQLKDQQTRGQFAKALATIGDTFANVGMARAGRDPQGYKGTEIVDKNNKDTQANLVENMKTQLANDPNSQTSRFAQQAAANILGIKPGDPRMAGLAHAPAAVLSSQLPSLGESIKPQLEREAQTIQQHQFEESKRIQQQQILQQQKDREAQLAISAQGAKTAQEKERNELATGAVKDLSPLNPANWGTIGKAKTAINNAISTEPAQVHPHDALAVHWAHTHPNDPRAAQILKANGL